MRHARALCAYGTQTETCSQLPRPAFPREIDLPQLLSSADRASQDMDVDIRDLLDAGSSLGGARPKASMRDEHGDLWMAKFPKSAEVHLEAWGN